MIALDFGAGTYKNSNSFKRQIGLFNSLRVHIVLPVLQILPKFVPSILHTYYSEQMC